MENMHTNGRVYTCIVRRIRISCYSYLFKKATDSKCNRPEVCQVRSNFKFTDICQMYRLARLNHWTSAGGTFTVLPSAASWHHRWCFCHSGELLPKENESLTKRELFTELSHTFGNRFQDFFPTNEQSSCHLCFLYIKFFYHDHGFCFTYIVQLQNTNECNNMSSRALRCKEAWLNFSKTTKGRGQFVVFEKFTSAYLLQIAQNQVITYLKKLLIIYINCITESQDRQ